jgi:hypothetical protein
MAGIGVTCGEVLSLTFLSYNLPTAKTEPSRCMMEIDLDNLVFNGLEEAQERNAERLEDADKKAQAVVADDDCGDACKI